MIYTVTIVQGTIDHDSSNNIMVAMTVGETWQLLSSTPINPLCIHRRGKIVRLCVCLSVTTLVDILQSYIAQMWYPSFQSLECSTYFYMGLLS